MADSTQILQYLKQQMYVDLRENILPFWMNHTLDNEYGGFYGALTHNLQVLKDAPKGGILCARILWTYATAYRVFQDASYLEMAQRAYEYLSHYFWDVENGGVYWMLDHQGQPLRDHKHTYAQGFAIYGLAEYYRATGALDSLALAKTLFRLIEKHAYDAVNQGYIEGCNRQWGALDDMRLSAKEPNAQKSMNTLLHLMEAYTNLLRVWPDSLLAARHRELIEIFMERVLDNTTYHFNLFFDRSWQSTPQHISYGHDIEGSWLLVEAAEVSGDTGLLSRVRETAVRMAQAVYDEGVDVDGSVFEYRGLDGVASPEKHWWPQAEAVVGFLNAFQISGQPHFLDAASRCWDYIAEHFIDREYGGWFRVLSPDGTPDISRYKVGPWECPYHNARACFEVLIRVR